MSMQFSLPVCIETRQDRTMSIQADRTELTIVGTPESGTAACSPPLVGQPLGESAAADLAQIFRALGDPVRLRLVTLIGAHQGGEVCVCDLTSAFNLTQPTISHHLKVLHEAGLLDREKRGVWVYYRARTQALASLAALIGNPRS